MCTVSFVRVNDTVIITSNRDEHVQRENAGAPEFHQLQNKKIIFPKDARAGGTWFAAGNNGIVAVLLNGAFIKHTPQPPYRKSRGLILLEIIEAEEPLSFFKTLNLYNIEPFTIVLYQPAYLHELRWDGNDKHEKALDITGNYIWSSATLYTDEVIEHREDLFGRFIHTAAGITAETVHDFHGSNNGDAENGFVISRQTGMKTFSITQAVVQNNAVNFSHADLLQQKRYTETMDMNHAAIKI
ncbi:MAG: NRDE family protein [Ferruginibacter sp.]|nr:NRDE family protein [Chitinophagaceae bacterium]